MRDAENCAALIGSLQFDMIVERPYKARQPYRFHDLAVSRVLPDQQIRDFSRIIETTAHKPSRDDGHVLAVEPRPETAEMAVSSVPLSSLIHRLIPVTILSYVLIIGTAERFH
jgi:hypothetical protein